MKSPLWIVLSLAASSAAWAQSNAGLASNSPFLPPASDNAPVAEATPLELRGILSMGGRTSFNIYDPATKSSSWVGLNESGQPYTVKNFDAATERVTVEYQGRSLALVLQRPKIVAAPVTAAPAGPPSKTPTPMPAAVLNPTPADEARRLEAVAAEVRRRRALRQQAAQMQAQQQQQGEAPPATPPPPAQQE